MTTPLTRAEYPGLSVVVSVKGFFIVFHSMQEMNVVLLVDLLIELRQQRHFQLWSQNSLFLLSQWKVFLLLFKRVRSSTRRLNCISQVTSKMVTASQLL